jgi:hypothetical protein
MNKPLKVINYAKGGIGNQLFQHIFGQSLANKLNAEYYSDISSYTNDSYRNNPTVWDLMPEPKLINIKDNNPIGSYLLIEDNYKNINEKLILPEDISSLILNGYWQSENYMDSFFVNQTYEYLVGKCRDIINIDLAKEMAEHPNSIALHIRRKDYAHMGLCKHSYYIGVVEYLMESLKDCAIYLFSDEPNFAQHILINQGISFTHVQHENDLAVLYLMSLCKHFIISNSSFSFWGAYFGEKRGGNIYSPKEWTTIEATISPLPSRWIQISDSIMPYEIDKIEKEKYKQQIKNYQISSKIKEA